MRILTITLPSPIRVFETALQPFEGQVFDEFWVLRIWLILIIGIEMSIEIGKLLIDGVNQQGLGEVGLLSYHAKGRGPMTSSKIPSSLLCSSK